MEHQARDAALGHEAQCKALPDVNHPIQVTADTDLREVTDVSSQFFAVFVAGLVLNMLTAMWSITACFLSKRR